MFRQLVKGIFKNNENEDEESKNESNEYTRLLEATKKADIINTKKMSESEQEERCKQCRGLCCKNCGCHFSPDNFKEISYSYLKNELEKGYISIAYATDEFAYAHMSSGIFFLRIRNKEAKIIDCGYWPMPHRGCIIQKETGCPFTKSTRPQGGIALNPEWGLIFTSEVRCKTWYDVSSCTKDWLPYQDILKELIEEFKNYPANYPCKFEA